MLGGLSNRWPVDFASYDLLKYFGSSFLLAYAGEPLLGIAF